MKKNSDDFKIVIATKERTITDSYEFVPTFNLRKIEFDIAGTRHCKDIDEHKKSLQINKKLYLNPNQITSVTNVLLKSISFRICSKMLQQM